MAKLNLDADKLKGFFFLHFEKMVLGVVIIVLVLLVYSGYSLEGLDKTPKELAELAQTAKSSMEKDTWAAIEQDYRPETGYSARVKAIEQPIPYAEYATTKPLVPPTAQQGEKRKDPELFPPANLEAYAVSGLVAYPMKRDELDALAELDPAELKEKQVKKKRKKKKRRDPYAMMGEDGGMFSGMEDEGSMEMEDEGSMASGMSEDGGSMFGMATGPSASPEDFPGFRPGAGAIGRPRNIIAVKAVVELQRQWDEYEAVFSNAMGYNPMRDVPKYLVFSAQRADVTDDPAKEPEESDWQPFFGCNTNSVRNLLEKDPWYAAAREVADLRYLDPNLTAPIPPLMFRELGPLALHSLVPRMQTVAATTLLDETVDETTEDVALGDTPVSDVPGVPPAGAMGRGGPMGGMGGPMGGMGGGGMMPPGMMGGAMMMGGGYYSGEDEGDYGSMGEDEGAMGMMSGGYYEDEDMGGGGYSGMGRMAAARGPKAEYALVRFFDFFAKPGRKYRYRVRVLLEDPNHPANARLEPAERTLDDEVKNRLQALADQEKEKESRVYYKFTEYSEPSDVISLEPAGSTLAGSVELGRETPIGNSRFSISTSEPKGKVMSVVWDVGNAVDVPGESDVYLGSTLNYTATANIVHPVTLEWKKLPDFPYATNRTIVDLRGGEPLGSNDQEDKPFVAPGEYAVLDERGNLFVRNELDDWAAFERWLPPMIESPSTDVGGMNEDMEMEQAYGGGRRGRRGFEDE